MKKKTAELTRSGLLLDEKAVLRAMERGGEPRCLPVKLNREGRYVGDALATAEQLGQLSAYIDALLADMAKELRGGSIAADPWYRSEQDNTCLYCEYFSACHFDGSTESWRRRKKLKAPEFWAKLAGGGPAEGGEDHAADS